MNLNSLKELILDLLFPKFCLNCNKEGEDYLCQDCLSLIDISPSQYCPFCRPAKIVLNGRTCSSCKRTKNLDGLYNAASYQNFIIKKLISQFKYEPRIKTLSKPLSLLIIKHFQLLEHHLNTGDAVLTPIPLTKKKLKQRGFNQSEEIAKELSSLLKIPLGDEDKSLSSPFANARVINDVLIKTKETPSQVELSGREREENVRGAFVCKNPEAVRGKKILLIDDVFTTGSTMEECARVLKDAGAKDVWGIVVARE